MVQKVQVRCMSSPISNFGVFSNSEEYMGTTYIKRRKAVAYAGISSQLKERRIMPIKH